MKNLIAFSIVLVSFITSTNAQTVTGEAIFESIMVGSTERTFIVYVPKSYDGTIAVPLLLNHHGLGTNDSSQMALSGFREIADAENFIMVLPNSGGGGLAKSFKTFTSVADVKSTDILFIDNLIDSIKAEYKIDTNRIYATGASNGGFMSYDLACFSRQPIAAIASVMGSMSPNRVDAIEANHPIPVLEIHGTADNIVKYTGGAGSPPFTRPSLDIDVLISFWVNFNNCDTAAVMTIIPDTNTDDNSTVEHYVYSGGENGATVEFYKVIGGGHQWPGATDPIQTEFGNRNMDMNSSEVIWEFLSKKSYLTNIANAKAENTNIKIKVYPNPTSGIITVNCDICAVENQIITVYNTYGTVVYTEVLTNNNSKINLSNLAKGLYFYKAANQLSGSIVIQ